jgi:hypothetical protein
MRTAGERRSASEEEAPPFNHGECAIPSFAFYRAQDTQRASRVQRPAL